MDFIEQLRANSNDGRVAPYCFPGGSIDSSHDILQGYLSFGMRETRLAGMLSMDSAELGVCGVGGIRWDDYSSQEDMESRFYLQGVVVTEFRQTHPLDSATSDPDSGYTFIRCGTKTTINNGKRPIYPGQLVKWKFPDAPFAPNGPALFNNGSDITPVVNNGVPATDFRLEIEPFDPTDLNVQLTAVYSAIFNDYNQNGIQNMEFAKLIPAVSGSRERPWTKLQEMAGAFKFGSLSIGAAMLEAYLVNGGATQEAAAAAARTFVGTTMGAFTPTADNAVMRDFFQRVFLRHISPIHAVDRATALANFTAANGARGPLITDNTVDEKYAAMRYHGLSIHAEGPSHALFSALDKVFARALNYAAQGDDVDLNLGLTLV
jgi:hypothetical protein